MKHRCVIIDDESPAIQILTEYIEMMPELELFKSFDNPVKALNEIDEDDDISIIFMDIDMPQMSGLELAVFLRNRTRHLIFTSAHASYAIEAFDLKASHYLLKPFGFVKFGTTVKEIIADDASIHQNKTREDDIIFIRSELKNKLIKINIKDIIVIEAMNNYIQIHAPSVTHTVYLTMKELKKSLADRQKFIQVHKSFIINKNFITNVEGALIRMSNKLLIPIGTTYKDDFDKYVKQKTLKSGRLN